MFYNHYDLIALFILLRKPDLRVLSKKRHEKKIPLPISRPPLAVVGVMIAKLNLFISREKDTKKDR